MQCVLISGIKTCSEAVLWNQSERIAMSQRHQFSTVSCFRRFASRDRNISLCWSLHLSEVILWCWNCMNDLKKSDLKMTSLNVRTTYHIYYFTFKLYFFAINFFITLTKLYSFKKYISYRPILASSSAMTLIMYIWRSYQFRNLLILIVENWPKFWY
jgi:hypothetical protein